METRKYLLPFTIVGASLFLESCNNNVLDPQFEPEISNTTDSFEFQATDVRDVSQTVQYTWQNSGTMANINQSGSISAGSATLTINDADGTEIYRADLSETGTFITSAGKAGNWSISLSLSGFDGTLNFSSEKRTP
jgi:hypothetical protein